MKTSESRTLQGVWDSRAAKLGIGFAGVSSAFLGLLDLAATIVHPTPWRVLGTFACASGTALAVQTYRKHAAIELAEARWAAQAAAPRTARPPGRVRS